MKTLICAIWLFGFSASAATYYVALNGDDSVSCTSAQNINTPKRNIMGGSGGMACLRTPGDKLYVRAGTYNESITNASLPLPSGTSWTNSFTVAAYPGEIVTLTQSIRFGDCCFNPVLSQLSYWIFDGFRIITSDAISNGDHVDHLRFTNMDITNNNWANNVGTPNWQGMCISGHGSFLEFTNIEVHDCGAYGAYYTGQDTVFDHIKMHDVHGYGFHLYHYGSNDVNRNTVRNSVFYNIIPVAPTGIYPGLGILLASGDGNQAYNNIVYNSGGGIGSGNGASNSKIYNNTVYNISGVGIGAGGVNGAVLRNNISYNSGVADMDDCGSACGVSGTVFSNNICSNNKFVYSRTLCTAIDNPLFVNPAAIDFHLSLGSPAINAGADLSSTGFSTDFAGTVRPEGAWDIGAYEYAGGSTGADSIAPTASIISPANGSVVSRTL